MYRTYDITRFCSFCYCFFSRPPSFPEALDHYTGRNGTTTTTTTTPTPRTPAPTPSEMQLRCCPEHFVFCTFVCTLVFAPCCLTWCQSFCVSFCLDFFSCVSFLCVDYGATFLSYATVLCPFIPLFFARVPFFSCVSGTEGSDGGTGVAFRAPFLSSHGGRCTAAHGTLTEAGSGVGGG